MRILERDRAILKETFLCGLTTRRTVEELGYFTSPGRANARLLELRDAGLLNVRLDVSGLELRRAVYTCTREAVRLIAGELGFDLREALNLHRKRQSDLTLRHTLRSIELREYLRSELFGDDLRLEDWHHELFCHHEFVSPYGKRATVKPDALAVFAGQERLHCFVEVDLGNVSLPRIDQKVRCYDLYASCGAFEEAYGVPTFKVLTVTTDEVRLRHLARITRDPRFCFTSWKRIEKASIGSVLTTSGGSESTLLQALTGGTKL